MYKVVKRDGETICFDLSKIVAAIETAFEAENALDQLIEEIQSRVIQGDTDAEYERTIADLEQKRNLIKSYRKAQQGLYKRVLRIIWANRNKGAGRSNTGSVSDLMLQTMPTPPTSGTVQYSLQKWRTAYGAAA